jgi:DNA-directed RNA polymerase specialized sigma24 family protein
MSPLESNEMNSPRDALFFQRLQRHDAAAWDELVGVYSLPLQRHIIQSLLSRNLPSDLVDDVEQQTWLTAVRLIEDFVWQNEAKLYDWFRVIATFHIKHAGNNK